MYAKRATAKGPPWNTDRCMKRDCKGYCKGDVSGTFENGVLMLGNADQKFIFGKEDGKLTARCLFSQ
jgi:hypothetical protein